MEPGLVGIQPKWTDSHWISGEQWLVVSHFSTDLTRASCGKLVGPCLSLNDAGSKGQQCEVISVGHHVKARDGTVRHKVVKKGWGDDESLCDPCRQGDGRVFLVKTSLPRASEVCHEQSNHVVSELEANQRRGG